MIKHLLKQIWTQRTVNAWLWVELLIVSICLAYVTDYLYTTASVYFSPLGFNTEHVYKVGLGSVEPSGKGYIATETDSTQTQRLLEVLTRIRAYPGVETVAVCLDSYPYYMGSCTGSKGIDTTWVNGNIRYVSPDYFRVFRITDKQGNIDPLVMAAKEPNTLFLTEEAERQFAKEGIEAKGSGVKGWGKTEPTHTFRAVCTDLRIDEFEPVYPLFYECYSEKEILDMERIHPEICFRVTPEEDTADYISRFRKDMRTQLRLGNVYFQDVTSISDLRDSYFRRNGSFNDVKTKIAALAFLLINILLGVVGSFWIRTQQRRAEMGLRLALGSSHSCLRGMLIGEGLLLLLLAFIPAAIVSLNIGYADLYLSIRGETPFTFMRFIYVQSITLFLMAIMIACGIYLPARQAMKIQPAEVLHEE